MAIRSITLSNFKSFSRQAVTLRDFNVIIGSNAAGKSNFIHAFRFLRDIAASGLENAIAMQGGADYLLNARIGTAEPLMFSVVYTPDHPGHNVVTKDGTQCEVHACESRYEFSLRFRAGGGYEIIHDELVIGCDFDGVCRDPGGKEPGAPHPPHGEIRIENRKGKLRFSVSIPEGIRIDADDIIPFFFRTVSISEEKLLLETPYATPIPQIDHFFNSIGLYDFNPRLPKKGIAIAGKNELEEDGSNLALAVKRILDNPEKKRQLSNLIRDIFPFIDEVNVKKSMDISWVITLRERYAKEYELPAFALSDGTISIFMLIIILYFEEKPFLVVEEPVGHIHPFLVTRIVSMLKEASARRQIMATTHSVEMVKHAGLEDILLISRDRDGFSAISRPADQEEVRVFLENELGIEDLYLQNVLEF